MSEDTLKIEFKSKLLSKNKRTEYEHVYRKYVPEQDTDNSESSINYTGKKVSYYVIYRGQIL